MIKSSRLLIVSFSCFKINISFRGIGLKNSFYYKYSSLELPIFLYVIVVIVCSTLNFCSINNQGLMFQRYITGVEYFELLEPLTLRQEENTIIQIQLRKGRREYNTLF